MAKQTFIAAVKKTPMGNSACISPPFDVEKVFGKNRVKVRCHLDGVEFRSSIMRMGGSGHFMVLNKQIRAKIGKEAGDTVHVVMEEDTKPRIAVIPPDVAKALGKRKKLKAIFDALSYSHQKEYMAWIESAKKPDTRATRIEKMLKMLEA
jgi:Bacteriocin-protection, YdeI or OmpD-Associated/Domain of unknown function (DUF1905)